MNKTSVTAQVKERLRSFLKENKKADLVTFYLHYLEQAHNVAPVVFIPDRLLFCNQEQALTILEKEQSLWRETEIKITFEKEGVTNETKKIYICPFGGKVFADNTHPNPQDAIYDWVAKCPENNERIGGLKSKRFHVSEDPEIIKNYISPASKTITKRVFSSAINGKLFASQEAVVADTLQHYFKKMSLAEVQNQNRYQMHETLLTFLQKELEEGAVRQFVDSLSDDPFFKTHISQWLSEEASEEE